MMYIIKLSGIILEMSRITPLRKIKNLIPCCSQKDNTLNSQLKNLLISKYTLRIWF